MIQSGTHSSVESIIQDSSISVLATTNSVATTSVVQIESSDTSFSHSVMRTGATESMKQTSLSFVTTSVESSSKYHSQSMDLSTMPSSVTSIKDTLDDHITVSSNDISTSSGNTATRQLTSSIHNKLNSPSSIHISQTSDMSIMLPSTIVSGLSIAHSTNLVTSTIKSMSHYDSKSIETSPESVSTSIVVSTVLPSSTVVSKQMDSITSHKMSYSPYKSITSTEQTIHVSRTQLLPSSAYISSMPNADSSTVTGSEHNLTPTHAIGTHTSSSEMLSDYSQTPTHVTSSQASKPATSSSTTLGSYTSQEMSYTITSTEQIVDVSSTPVSTPVAYVTSAAPSTGSDYNTLSYNSTRTRVVSSDITAHIGSSSSQELLSDSQTLTRHTSSKPLPQTLKSTTSSSAGLGSYASQDTSPSYKSITGTEQIVGVSQTTSLLSTAFVSSTPNEPSTGSAYNTLSDNSTRVVSSDITEVTTRSSSSRKSLSEYQTPTHHSSEQVSKSATNSSTSQDEHTTELYSAPVVTSADRMTTTALNPTLTRHLKISSSVVTSSASSYQKSMTLSVAAEDTHTIVPSSQVHLVSHSTSSLYTKLSATSNLPNSVEYSFSSLPKADEASVGRSYYFVIIIGVSVTVCLLILVAVLAIGVVYWKTARLQFRDVLFNK